MMILIHPPSPYASRKEWEDFLSEMRERDQEHPQVIEAIKLAEAALAAQGFPPHTRGKRGGSVCLNRIRCVAKWISAFRVMPQPGLAVAG